MSLNYLEIEYDWSSVSSRKLHPDIGIPADSSQGLPYLDAPTDGLSPNGPAFQNFGLSYVMFSGDDSLTGYLFTASKRYIVGSGEVKAINTPLIGETYYYGPVFAIDGLNGTAVGQALNGTILGKVSISGNNMGWTGSLQEQTSGEQGAADGLTYPGVSFLNYQPGLINYNYIALGYGASSGTYGMFPPSGPVAEYSNGNENGNGLPYLLNGGVGLLSPNHSTGSSSYGVISSINIQATYYLPISFISFGYNTAPIIIAYESTTVSYGYKGTGSVAKADNWGKIGYQLDIDGIYAVDPTTFQLLELSPNIITVDGLDYYPVYVYNSVNTNLTAGRTQMVRHYAHNYSRGVPYGGSLSGIAPNTNTFVKGD